MCTFLTQIIFKTLSSGCWPGAARYKACHHVYLLVHFSSLPSCHRLLPSLSSYPWIPLLVGHPALIFGPLLLPFSPWYHCIKNKQQASHAMCEVCPRRYLMYLLTRYLALKLTQSKSRSNAALEEYLTGSSVISSEIFIFFETVLLSR